ncbi:MAG: general secretion pathway protein GspE, partial [Glaciecola sp.]
GLDPVNFADACVGILAQRLIRTICPDCKETYKASDDDKAFIRRQYGESYIRELEIDFNADIDLNRGAGCDTCGGTGYKGRTGVHELLGMSTELRSLVYKEASVPEMKAQAAKDGMRTLTQDAILKVLKGDTDIAQVQILGGH